MTTFEPLPAARILADAWKTGRALTELPVDLRPRTLAEGYEVQDALIATLREPVGGWKLGVGSKAAMRAANLERPLVGRVLENRIHRNGSSVRLARDAPVTVEFEIAFVLGRDIAPGDRPAKALDAVSAIHATFELVLSRFVDRRAVGWPSFAGDSVGFEALIVGPRIDAADMEKVAASVVIDVDGKEAARGLAGDDLTDPLASFDFLLDHAKERGVTLKAGEIVTLGAIGKPFDLAHGGKIVARYLDAELRVTVAAR